MNTSNSQLTVGFLGAGKMATALAKGLIESGSVEARNVIASDVIAAAAESFASATGGKIASSNDEVLKSASIVFLAVKPQSIPALLREISPQVQKHHLIVSIAAGITLGQMEKELPQARIIRVMPNTPCLVGSGASVIARGTYATADDAAQVLSLLSTVGLALEMPESALDAVTGLSGSGPAYVFQIIEALSDGGVLVGLPRAAATQLAAQTLLGAAKMVLETGEHPGQLKDAVTSPGGTTIAGLLALEQGGLRAALMNAVRSATERSRQLSGNH